MVNFEARSQRANCIHPIPLFMFASWWSCTALIKWMQLAISFDSYGFSFARSKRRHKGVWILTYFPYLQFETALDTRIIALQMVYVAVRIMTTAIDWVAEVLCV